MKNIPTLNLLIFLFLLFCQNVFAQNNVTIQEIPNAIAYDGIAYDANDAPLTNQSISIRASILIGSITGSVEWQEVHSTLTRDDGSFSIVIGEGT